MKSQGIPRRNVTAKLTATASHHIEERRAFLRRMSLAMAAGAIGTGWLEQACRAANGPAVGPELTRFPEKTDLILQTGRPPNLETPLRYFREDLTSNEAFYVRWHLAILPTRVDLAEFRLNLGGHVERPLSLSLEELRKDYEPVSVVAVNQCSGNSRSLYQPRMPGVQWGNGALGNARWTGVRLAD